MKRLTLACAIIASAVIAEAQVATSTSRLAWDQVAETLAEASSYTYRASFDGGGLVTLTGVACAGAASPFICSATFPTLSHAAHSVAMVAVNAAGVSPLSASFSFFMSVQLPSAPQNLRILPGPRL